jgi:hypothetical protein
MIRRQHRRGERAERRAADARRAAVRPAHHRASTDGGIIASWSPTTDAAQLRASGTGRLDAARPSRCAMIQWCCRDVADDERLARLARVVIGIATPTRQPDRRGEQERDARVRSMSPQLRTRDSAVTCAGRPYRT